LKLTIDSTEPLEDAMRVLGALYGVTLAVSPDGQDVSGDNGHARQPVEKPRPAKRRPSVTRKARTAVLGTDTDANADVGEPKQETPTRSAGSPSNAEVRSWASQNGITVSDRGRIPASVMTAFRNAHTE
jgi:hypothetical protein